MAKDLYFYNFEFELLYILAPHNKNSGYISVSAEQELNSSGAMEIEFYDVNLKKIIEENKNTLMVNWNGFWGFVTSYRWDSKMKIYGMHLNGLLHRIAVPPAVPAAEGTPQELILNALKANTPWLFLQEQIDAGTKITWQKEGYSHADEYIKELCKLGGIGYEIIAEKALKRFSFRLIPQKENALMLSEENLNAYEFEVTYINKELAFGGWYKSISQNAEEKDGESWHYISLAPQKQGIYKIDCVLKAQNEAQAKAELKNKCAEYEITAKTKGIEYLKDYNLGNILRVQKEGICTKKLVSGIRMWEENGYGEEPVLSEIEEE